MDEKSAYMRIAERSVIASKKLADDRKQESSAFFSYHAFESLGGALCAHLAMRYSLNHGAKINQFIAAAKRTRCEHGVARVAIIIGSVERNKCLYPSVEGPGAYSLPESRLTSTDAKDLCRRVSGLVSKIRDVTDT